MQIYAFYNILFTRFLPEQNRPHQFLALLEAKSKILMTLFFACVFAGVCSALMASLASLNALVFVLVCV